MTEQTAPPTAYHLRPGSGWLNDPNGMVFTGGRWHVFFQHNPDAPRHDRIAWGHLSSADLVTWREHPVAFGPTPGGPDAFGCWSGVFVDGLDTPVVVYSGVTGPDGQSTVCLRRGSDDLDDWGAPTVVATTPEVDDVAIMRDPFVFTHGGHRFALLGAGLTDGTPAALLFGCDDLEDWDYLGVWLTERDLPQEPSAPADVWECPQLAVADGRATLLLSLHDRGTLGPVVGVSGTLTDDDGRPRLEPQVVEVLDEGTDFYAPQLATDHRDGWWLVGWVRDEDVDPAVSDHAGCMTLPRRVVLAGLDDPAGARLVLDPAVESALELGPAEVLAAGQLPAHSLARAGRDGALLRHAELPDLSLPPGSLVLVDGPVLEVFRPAAAPATFRHPVPWSVEGAVEVSAVLTSSRAPRADTGAPRASG